MKFWCSSDALDLYAVSTRKKAAFVEHIVGRPSFARCSLSQGTPTPDATDCSRELDDGLRRVVVRSCPLPRSAPVVRPLNSPFSSGPRVGACCLASMDSTARRGECHRHPPSPHSACIDANPTMKMEAILAKMVSGRISSVLI